MNVFKKTLEVDIYLGNLETLEMGEDSLVDFVPAKWGEVFVPPYLYTTERLIIDNIKEYGEVHANVIRNVICWSSFFSTEFHVVFEKTANELPIQKYATSQYREIYDSLSLVNARGMCAEKDVLIKFDNYYQSEAWLATRDTILSCNRGGCCLCGSQKSLQVHHKTYKNIGCESVLDLSVLCQTCHDLWHKTKKGSDIYQSAKDFVGAFRALEKHF